MIIVIILFIVIAIVLVLVLVIVIINITEAGALRLLVPALPATNLDPRPPSMSSAASNDFSREPFTLQPREQKSPARADLGVPTCCPPTSVFV